MKRLKKILALALAMAMVLSIGSMTAFAAGTHSITVPSTDTHTYQVYQILTGTLSTDNTTLSNAAWGSSTKTATDGKINNKTVTEFMKDMEALSGNAAVTEAMKYVDLEKPLSGTVTKDQGMSGLAEGYYILVDITDPLTNKDENNKVISTDTKALSLLQLLDDVTVTKKWGTTEDKKTIDTDTLGQTGTNTNTINDDDDNVSIGDTVNYKIEATVPENTDKFVADTFFFVVTDKLSSGLTFNNDIKVYLKGAGDAGADLELTANDDYTVKTSPSCVYDTTNTFEVALKDAANAKYRGQTIVVKYSATVNEGAVIGDAGNPNTSQVKFSNNPDQTYNGKPDNDGDGFPDQVSTVPTGETPTSETKTYVTGIEILKVDENGEPLQNAKFEISGTSVKKVVTKTETFEEDADGNYYLLKDGTYTMVPPTTANEMIAAPAGATKGYVVDAEATGDDVIEIGGTKYRPVRAGETPTHILKVGSVNAYQDPVKKYKKVVTQKTVDADATDQKMEEQVDSNGLARFDGLGAGTYTITETKTPDGYNTIDPITVKVNYSDPDASGAPTTRFEVTQGNATYEDGIIKITIVNKKGQKLPETGGIGTTIFYVVGTILVIGAGVVLITRRRMEA
jgi:fimbrial isopeptide formation D2 family protein/LPXTG-motif cell wall-anchored protein